MKESLKFIDHLWGRCLLGVLALIVIALNVPYFQSNIIPRHDSMLAYELYHFFYSNLLFNKEIAQWMPFDTFGLLSNHEQLESITPFSYLSFLAGYIFKIKDALLLFKATLLAEQLIFLMGMYLLSRALFAQKSTIFILCLAAVSYPDMYHQVNFNFRIFYLLPLGIYFLLLFFERKKPKFFWLVGVVFMAWITGTILYYISLWTFIFTILFVGLYLISDKKIWHGFKQPSNYSIFLIVVCVVVAASLFVHLKEMLDFVDLRSRGPGGKNSLGMFLTWSTGNGLSHFYQLQTVHNPSTRYIGLLPLFFFVWAILKVRSKIFFVFLAATVLLWWYSAGGIFSALCYFFPGMSYYRHIGLIDYVIHIFMLLCAGFGWESFWKTPGKVQVRSALIVAAILVFLIDAFRVSGDWIMDFYLKGSDWKGWAASLTLNSVPLKYMVYLAAVLLLVMVFVICNIYEKKTQRKLNRGWMGPLSQAVLIAAFLFDIFSSQLIYYKAAEKLSDEYRPLLYTLQAHPMQFQEKRTEKPVESRQKDAYQLVTRPEGRNHYSVAYSFFQFDSCFSEFKTHMLPLGFSRFTQTRYSIDEDFLRTIGCYTPKIRLVSKAVYTDTLERTTAAMRIMPKIFDTAVLRGVDAATKDAFSNQPPRPRENSEIRMKKFSANQVAFDVNVPYSAGAWLVYADSYHPGWKAYIDGKRVSVFEAYLNFKAVLLTGGQHHVRFAFENGLGSVISQGIALFGLAVAFTLAAAFVWVLLMGDKQQLIINPAWR